MMPTCPFCNAPITLEEGLPAGEKFTCLRCGEPLPPNLPDRSPIRNRPTQDTCLPLKPYKANRRVAVIVLAIMFAMAAGGLVLALRTRDFRRSNDYRRGLTGNVRLLPPGEWAALGYLPAETNLLAGVRISELLQDSSGRRLFDVPRPPLLEVALETVDRWTALKPIEIDHVVFGAEVTDKLPQVVFAVRTVKPYDAAALAKALRLSTSLTYRDRTAFRQQHAAAHGLVFCADDRTVVGLVRLDVPELRDLDAFPSAPRKDTAGLSAPLQEVLGPQRLNKQGLAWCAGDLSKAVSLQDLLAFTKIPAGDVDLLAKIKSFALALYPEEGWTVSGNFFTGDAKATRTLHERLHDMQLAGVRSLKADAPPPDVASQDQWVLLQIRADPEGIRQLLSVSASPVPKR